jgi:ferric-dicitrate binding protein FerR (iron transport regulator)
MLEKERISNYYSGDYSAEEELHLGKAFAEESNHVELKTLFSERWNTVLSEDEVHQNLDHLLHKLNYLINSSSQELKVRPVNKLITWYARIAAVLLIPLLVYAGIAIFKNRNSLDVVKGWAEINAPKGARIKFTLPDGSFGWLNSGSTLQYALNFNNARVVQLSGEAFFDVSQQEGKLFLVKTKYLDVEVKGTSFDVAAYDGEENIDITLENGSVILRDQKLSRFVEMKPNEQVSYNVAKQLFTKANVAAFNFSAWKEGKLILRNASLEELAKQLSRWYNVETKIQNDQNIVCQFRATFEDENLPEVLRLLKLSSNLDYTIDERVKQADGTFSKQHVLLKVKQ